MSCNHWENRITFDKTLIDNSKHNVVSCMLLCWHVNVCQGCGVDRNTLQPCDIQDDANSCCVIYISIYRFYSPVLSLPLSQVLFHLYFYCYFSLNQMDDIMNGYDMSMDHEHVCGMWGYLDVVLMWRRRDAMHVTRWNRKRVGHIDQTTTTHNVHTRERATS